MSSPGVAALYLRISEDPTGQAAGVERQEDECRALASRLGLTIPDGRVYTDNDRSATRGRRPAWERMLTDLAGLPKGRRVVVAWHQDRLLRTTRDLERVIELDATVHFKEAATIDLATPTGRAVARTVAAWSQFEVEQKAARQRTANAQAHKAGKPYWRRRPFGYELDGTTSKHEADAIRWAAATILDGGSVRSVAREWARRGLTTYAGNPWSPVQVRRVLLSERIAGLRTYEGKTVRGTWDPILPEDAWRSLAATLTAPRRGAGNPGGRRPKTLLGGIATCGACGRVLHGSRVNGVPYYACAAKDLYRKADAVEVFVTEAILARLARPDALEVHRPASPGRDLAAEAAALRARMEAFAAAASQMLPEQWLKINNGLMAELAAIEAEMAATPRIGALVALLGVDDVRGAWHDLDLERQRAVITALLSGVVLAKTPSRSRARFDPATVDRVYCSSARAATRPSGTPRPTPRRTCPPKRRSNNSQS